MIIPFKDREIDPDAPVDAYLNLHKTREDGKAWYSLRQRGRVVGHADTLYLRDARFHVNPEGRDKVRRTGRKNVHAHISGFVFLARVAPRRRVQYNPVRDETFHVGGQQIDEAEYVALLNHEVYAA